MRGIKLFLLFFLSLVKVFSQHEIISDTLKVNYIGQEKGLLQLNVIDMEQDDLGYLWLGTQDGLHRFNSNKFKIYLNNPQDSLSIPDDQVRDFYIANDTLFAISSSEGAFGLDLKKDSFFKIFKEKKKTGYKILPMNKRYFIYSLTNQFLLYDRLLKKTTEINLPIKKKENYINSIAQIDEDNFVLATRASGLLVFNINKRSLKELFSIDNSSHNAIYIKDNEFIVGTEKGLYSKGANQKEKLLIQDEINCIYKNGKQLLVGGKTGLLTYNLIDSEINKIILKDFSNKIYQPIGITTIRGDKKGNVWFGTRGEGLLHYNYYKSKFETIELKLPKIKADNKISSYQFLPLADSTFFIGSTYGVLKYDCWSRKIKHYKETDNILIYTIQKDFENNIWAGGYTSGLLKYNEQKDKFEEVVTEGVKISDKDLSQITPLADSKMLLATWSGGIYLYDFKKNNVSKYLINGREVNRARSSFLDSKSRLWIGTEEGVFCIDGDKEKAINYNVKSKSYPISGDRVFGIAEDSLGNIWLGTNVGLTKLDFEKEESTLYYQQKGLPNDFIYAVLIDDNDNVWCSTNMGISALDVEKDVFTNFLESDGLQNNEFNGKSAYKDKYGNFYFGGIVGVNVFNPNKLKNNPFEPEVHIESVELFNSEINRNELHKDFLEFKSDQNVITFNYAALNYLNPEKVNYSYFMEGFDKEWRPVTKKKSTTYTNLNPGDYVFRLKATNDSGVWSNQQDKIQIRITPPWYETKFFRFLLAISTGGLLLLFFYIKERKVKKDKLKLEAIIADRTEELIKNTKDLEKAYIKAESQGENIRFLMKELQHRVKNNLQIISSLLNIQSHVLEDGKVKGALKVAKNRILTISHLESKINANNDEIELNEFTTDICDSILNVLSDENSLFFNVEYEVENVVLKNINTTIYGLILNELITNTVKYAFDSYDNKNKLQIKGLIKEEKLFLVVQDNGKGYDKRNILNTSLGLNLVKDMVRQLKGTIIVDVEMGTKNTIIIPILDNVN